MPCIHFPRFVSLLLAAVISTAAAGSGELLCSKTTACPGELVHCRCSVGKAASSSWTVNGHEYSFAHEDLGRGDNITLVHINDTVVISQLNIHLRNADIAVACDSEQKVLRLAELPNGTAVKLSSEICNSTAVINVGYSSQTSVPTWFEVEVLPSGDIHQLNGTGGQIHFAIDPANQYLVRVTPMNCIGAGNSTEITINYDQNTSLVFTDANSAHTCVEHTTNCSSQHSVVTYADAITDTVQRWDVTGNEAACINTRSCGVWSLNSKQYAVQNFSALDSLRLQASSSDCQLLFAFGENDCARSEWLSVYHNNTPIPSIAITRFSKRLTVNLTSLTELLGRNVVVTVVATAPNGRTHRMQHTFSTTYCNSSSSPFSSAFPIKASLHLMVTVAALTIVFLCLC